ncbi:MAG: FIST C-terminal domain-containing protein [Candidatus Altiarchaeales archaeon]|nr:FIST C-terminal domain-containing protein [Candidatus Altiarchaeales archaeon]
MDKKIIIGICVGLVVVILIAWMIEMSMEKPPVISPEPSPKLVEQKRTRVVTVGYGWSTKDEPKEAVEEAVSLAKEGLEGESPDYVLIFSTVGYNSDEILGEVRRFLPAAQVYGGTSCLGVLTKDGFHAGKIGSLALLAVSSQEINFGVGGASLDELPPREAGKKAILSAIENAKDGKPKLILITAAPGKEEEILLGIEDIIGKDVPVIGGSSGDNDISGKWKQFANDKVYNNGVSLTAIYTDLEIGWAYEAGYLRTENRGTITRAEGRVIYEINNRPAAEVYNEWANGIISEKLGTGGTILSETTYYPLAKIIRGKGGEIHYLSIHPLSVELPERSLTVFANVKEEDEVQLMHGNWELLLNRAQTTPYNALVSENIPKGEGSFGIYTFCAGTMLAIPEEEISKMPLLISNSMGDIPFIGTFTFGEQGFLSGVGNRHGNLVNSMIIFAQEEQ